MIKNILHEAISNIVYEYIPLDSVEEMWDISGLENRLQLEYNLSINIKKWLDKEPNIEIETIANKLLNKRKVITFKKRLLLGKNLFAILRSQSCCRLLTTTGDLI